MLNVIWYILFAVLFIVFFILEGFDFGVGILLPFLAKDDVEKRIMINSIGPFWDGNEVWLITAGGATFAAFPKVYAALFSGFYMALIIILFGLILRGVAFEFRSKSESPGWRSFWDFCIFIGSFISALLWGVAFANIAKGVPIDEGGNYLGTFWQLLNPYALLGGLVTLSLFTMHGAIWLVIKTENSFVEKAKKVATVCWWLFTIFLVAFLTASAFVTSLFQNYLKYSILWFVPILTVVSLLIVKLSLKTEFYGKAFIFSCLTILFTFATLFIGLFPNMLPSSINPAYSLTAFNASSSPYTLKVMLIVVLIATPIVIAYQIWVYKLFAEKVKKADIQS
jgi:cytochrome d ubiquinol oxidase subunit II